MIDSSSNWFVVGNASPQIFVGLKSPLQTYNLKAIPGLLVQVL